jgi:hypothetical protein
MKIKTKGIQGTRLGCKGTRAEWIQGFGFKSRILNFFKSNIELDQI